jgi:hypothetical protein
MTSMCMIITSVGQNYVFCLLHSPCRNKIKHLKPRVEVHLFLDCYSSNCVERCKKPKWPHQSVINLPRNDQGHSKPVIILYLTSTHLHLYFLFCLVFINYMSSGWYSWCKLFFLIYCCNLPLCSIPGLVSFCCTVKNNHPRHTWYVKRICY